LLKIKMNFRQHLTNPIFKIISEISESNHIKSFVIGGYVRDIIINRNSDDIDIVTDGNGIDLAKSVANKIGHDCNVSVYNNFGTAMLHFQDLQIEFVGARKESYIKSSRKPFVVQGTLEDDQKRRDFTVNAIAISLNTFDYGELIDPFDGVLDIERQIIRTPLDPLITFSDDPLRMIRAARFASQLHFEIDNITIEAMNKNKERISIVSKERITEELNKILASDIPSNGLIILEDTGLLNIIFPQLSDLKGINTINRIAHKDNFYHTIKVVDNIAEKSSSLWLRWAGLLHDIAKPQTRQFHPEHGWTFHGHDFYGARMVPEIFKSLKLPLNEKMKYVEKLVLLHLRPIVLAEEIVTDSAIRRLLFDAGEDIEDLMLLAEADITSKNETKRKNFLKNFQLVREKLKLVEQKDKIRNWQPPISGEDIIKTFNINPCKTVGDIKNSIREAILDGVIENNYESAFKFMIEKGKDYGLKPG
jgi:poly(A) polymerase